MEQGKPDQNIQQHQDQQQPPLRQAKPPENQMADHLNHNNHHHQHHQPPPPQKCPRCDSSNTKFCYYNNYSLSQPRYFCKACRRYWTQGGTLRNVPVGGGCRKSKRPKPLVPSSSADETARAQSSSAALQSQNLTGGLIPGGGQGFRALPPMMAPPSMGNTFYTGGSFLSSLAAMHSLQPGINQRATAVNLGGGNGNIQYDANSMAVLRAPAPPQYFQAQNDQFFPSTMAIPARPPLGSWTQTFINRGAASSSAGNPSFWGGATTAAAAENDNQASSSFNPNQWPDNNPGLDPPQ